MFPKFISNKDGLLVCGLVHDFKNGQTYAHCCIISLGNFERYMR